MNYMNNNGVYLDRNILGQLANSIYSRGDNTPQFIADYNTLARGGRIQPGYYNLNQVPIGGLGNVDIYSILQRYYGQQ